MVLKETNFATGANVLLKSNPGHWEKPCATKRALNEVTCPCLSFLRLKTNLPPRSVESGGSSDLFTNLKTQ